MIKEVPLSHQSKGLACLRHLLVGLKFSEASNLITQAVKCACKKDLDAVIVLMNKTYGNILASGDIKLFNLVRRILKKAGLFFDKDSMQVKIQNQEQWQSVSMIYRIQYRMPATTSALESGHGHLNTKTLAETAS